jgi:hypothetical protein
VHMNEDVMSRVLWMGLVSSKLRKQFERFGLVEDLIPAVDSLEKLELMMAPEDLLYRVDFLKNLRRGLASE